MLSTPSFARARRITLPALVGTVLLAGLSAGAASADSSPATWDELKAAVEAPCADGETISLALGFDDTGADTLTVPCDLTFDLNGQSLSLVSIVVTPGKHFTIEDNAGAGVLTADASGVDTAAGIAAAGATVTIRSGSVTATGGLGGTGIGGAYPGEGATVVIDGGTVIATGGQYAAGIGDAIESGVGDVTINGGTVTARGGEGAAGIGGSGSIGGAAVAGGNVTITGGIVVARSGPGGAGIGGGAAGTVGTVQISGGDVTAIATGDTVDLLGGGSGGGGAGIGSGVGNPLGGVSHAGGVVTITGGTIDATGHQYAAGIGGGLMSSGATVTIGSGADVTASSPFNAVGGGASIDLASFEIGTADAGTLSVAGILRIGGGPWVIVDSDPAVAEVTVLATGLIAGTTAPGAISGEGQIDNGGAITVPASSFEDPAMVLDRNYLVTFNAMGGTPQPDAVRVFAHSFDAGGRTLVDALSLAGISPDGWYLNAAGAGEAFTSTTLIASDITLYATNSAEAAAAVAAAAAATLAAAQAQVVTLTGQVAALTTELGAVVADNAALRSELTTVRSELTVALADLAALQGEHATALADFSALRAQPAGAAPSSTSSDAELVAALTRVALLEKALDTAGLPSVVTADEPTSGEAAQSDDGVALPETVSTAAEAPSNGLIGWLIAAIGVLIAFLAIQGYVLRRRPE